MVPDNAMRDDVFNCMIEKHKCIALPNATDPCASLLLEYPNRRVAKSSVEVAVQ